MVAHATLTAPLAARTARRRARFGAQRLLWEDSALPRVRRCGRALAQGTDGVQLRVTQAPDGNRAGFAGLQTCGSVWACPTCSAKILGERQGEVARAVDNHRATGGKVAFFTYTVRHDASQSIETVWAGVSSAHTSMTTGAEHQAEKMVHGTLTETPRGARMTIPWLRVIEVTHGSNGWHVHQHMVVFLPAGTSRQERDDLYWSMWKRWDRGARSSGLDGSARVNFPTWALDAQQIGTYVSKNTYSAGESLSLEAVRGDLKDGRLGNRSMMQLLADLVRSRGDLDASRDYARDLSLWRRFEKVSKGRRQMTWSVGARDLLGIGSERTDEDIAAEETGTRRDTVALLDGRAWYVVRSRARGRAELLEAAECAPAAAYDLLRSWGLVLGGHDPACPDVTVDALDDDLTGTLAA